MTRSLKLLAAAFACVALSNVSTGALAQSWPAKPITIVAPFGPGSGTDIVSRLYWYASGSRSARMRAKSTRCRMESVLRHSSVGTRIFK